MASLLVIRRFCWRPKPVSESRQSGSPLVITELPVTELPLQAMSIDQSFVFLLPPENEAAAAKKREEEAAAARNS